jgi:hypothetical protein
MTLAPSDAPPRGLDPTGCPPWCDPAQHVVDDLDTALVVVHRSRPVAAAALGSPRIEQTVRRFGTRIVRSPIAITVEGNGRTELQSRDEAANYLTELTRALVTLTNIVWPAQTSTLAS